MSRIEEFFEKSVDAGIIPQMPMNYDAVSYKIYTVYLENKVDELTAEVAELRARLENHDLPVNVGDTIYCIRNWGKGRYEIEEHTVTEIVFEYNNQMRIKTSCGLFGCEKWTFGLDCFADKSEAEAHIKELQGGER